MPNQDEALEYPSNISSLESRSSVTGIVSQSKPQGPGRNEEERNEDPVVRLANVSPYEFLDDSVRRVRRKHRLKARACASPDIFHPVVMPYWSIAQGQLFELQDVQFQMPISSAHVVAT